MGAETIELVATDGGVISKNPSLLGGTWAYALVGAGGELAGEDAGLVTPAGAGLPVVSNNYTELLAAVLGLEALPDGWAGAWLTDSLVTLRRVTAPASQSFANVPAELVARCHALRRRLGGFRAVLVGGHPTVLELEQGRRRDGKPVSRWNVHCDKACARLAAQFLAARAAAEGGGDGGSGEAGEAGDG